jgi:hypothetical protein
MAGAWMNLDHTPTWRWITSGYWHEITEMIPYPIIIILTTVFHAKRLGNQVDAAIIYIFVVCPFAFCLIYSVDRLLKIWRARTIYACDATIRRFEFSKENWTFAVRFMAARGMVPGKNDRWYYKLLKKKPVIEIREKSILIADEVLMEGTKVLAPERFVVNEAEKQLEVTFIRKRLRGLRFFPREDLEFSNQLDVPLRSFVETRC